MQVILPIVAIFLLGFAARRVIANTNKVVNYLNVFIVYVALPALILLKVPQLEFSAAMIVPGGVAWAWLLLSTVIVLLLSRWLAWPRATEGAMLLLVTMGNTSFLGYPMVLAYFNDAVLGYAIFFDQLGGFLILSSFGVVVVAIYAPSANGDVSHVGIVQIVKRIVSFPPFIALIIALSVPLDSIMVFAGDALELMGKLLMPAALFVLGVQFQPKLLPQHKRPLVIGIGLKLIGAPLLAALLLALMGSSGEVRTATIFEAAMPSMMTPGLMAISAGIAPRFVATLLGYCTVFAFLSLPIIAYLLTQTVYS